MKPEMRVGIFVSIGLIILFLATIFLTNLKWMGSGYEISVIFDSLNDMRVKSKVKFAGGVIVGSVVKIEYDEKNSNLIAVARINKDVKIRDDAQFSISTRGMMGEKYLNITGGSPDKPFVKPGAVIKGATPLSMDAGLGKLYTISDDFKAALASFNNIIGSPEMRKAVAQTSQNVTEAVANINKIIMDNRDKINNTFSSLEDSAGVMKEIANNLKGLSKELNDFANNQSKANFQDTLKNLNTMSAKLDDTINVIDKTIGSVNSLVKKAEFGEGTVGVLLNDKKMAEDLKALIKELRDDPSKILWGNKKK